MSYIHVHKIAFTECVMAARNKGEWLVNDSAARARVRASRRFRTGKYAIPERTATEEGEEIRNTHRKTPNGDLSRRPRPLFLHRFDDAECVVGKRGAAVRNGELIQIDKSEVKFHASLKSNYESTTVP